MSSSSPASEGVSQTLLPESGFTGAPGEIAWHGSQPLTPGWETETKPALLEGGYARLDGKGALTLGWPATAERVRLQQYLEPGPLADAPHGLDVHLQLILAGNFDPRARIDWIAILELQADGKSLYFHEKLPFTSVRLGNKVTVLSAAHVRPLDPARRYCLSIQCKGAAGEMAFRSARLTGSPAAKPVPVAPPQERKAETSAIRVVASVSPVVANDRRPAPVASGRKRALVIAWDMGHNPVGRAYLLAEVLAETYDVTLIGPLFKRYGGRLWSPLVASGIDIRTFPAEGVSDFLASALPFIRDFDADVIYACKARLPSMLLGILGKYYTGAPVILDVDDHELSFFPDRRPLELADLAMDLADHDDLALPFGGTWTRACETLVPCFDAVTVSNVSLQYRFGGTIVRHARDETKFGPDAAARAAVRAEFGYAEEDRVILFLGTPRAHKGVLRIAEAMRRLNDPRLRLCIIGSVNDRAMEQRIAAYGDIRIDLWPDRPWEELPRLIRLADGVCLLQDPTSPVAEYQIPAKLTDALSTGTPVAVTDVAPFRDIPESIVTRIRSDADLDAFLSGIADSRIGGADFADRARAYFLEELSYAAAGVRLAQVFDDADREARPWPSDFTALLRMLDPNGTTGLPHDTPFWLTGAPAIRRDRPIDIAFFWKQNDTGIYGRRHDMLLKYLSRHERVGRIVQFDAPVPVTRLNEVRLDGEAHLDQGNRVVAATLSRFLRAADSGNVARRVFVHGARGRQDSLLGVPLPPEEAYADWVRRTLREVAPERSFVSWVAPVVFDYPRIHDEMHFAASIADLIDDQRTMTRSPAYHDRLSTAYAETLKRADVVFANCGAAAQAFAGMRGDAHVVPNAAEILPRGAPDRRPHELARMTGPIIGYVGNLRDRIDLDLLRRMATERPDWNIVLIGSAHGDADILRLRELPNIHLLGVRIAAEATDYIRSFDVAIMPHVHNAISAAMNPLKLYVYCAAGVPVVSTMVENIEALSGLVNITPTPEAFVRRIDDIVADRQRFVPTGPLPFEHSWGQRVEEMFRVLDAKLA